MEHGAIHDILKEYKPSWFYFSSTFGNAYSIMLPQKTAPNYECVEVRSKSGQGGIVCYDVVRSTSDPDTKRVIFIIPGVNSSIQDHHICSTMK